MKQPVKPTPINPPMEETIHDRLLVLNNETSHLNSLIDTLNEKLGPVLRLEEPTPLDDLDRCIYSVPLMEAVQQQIDALERASRRITTMLTHLAI